MKSIKQISYIFVAKVLNDTSKINLTEKEKAEGAELIWVSPIDALRLMENSYHELTSSTYEVDYEDEINITAMKGLFNYSWTLNDSNGKIYNCDTGMYIIYINTSSLGLEKGDYTLSVSAKDVSNNKYTDTAVVIVK